MKTADSSCNLYQ